MGHFANLKKIAAGIGVVGALTAVTVMPALATSNDDTATASASVTAGNRTVTLADVTFGPTQYQFAEHTISATGVTLDVVDESGTNLGWQVSMTSTNLLSAGTGADIPVSGFLVTNVATVSGTGAVEGAGVGTGSLTGPGGQVVYSAAAPGGAGIHAATVDFGLTIPANQPVDSYTGTLTITIVQPPV